MFTGKWLLVVLLSMLPVFLVFHGNLARGRVAAVCTGIIMTAVRACWSMRTHAWFWIVAGAIVVLHLLLVMLVTWSDTSRGYLPLWVLDYVVVYKTFKLVEKASEQLKGRKV